MLYTLASCIFFPVSLQPLWMLFYIYFKHFELTLVTLNISIKLSVPVSSPYKLPFEEEVGLNPTLDEMRTCVVDNRRRPHLKPCWRRSQV